MYNDTFRTLKDVLPLLIGRTIGRIVVKEHDRQRTQLFLFFTDGTYYEFYSTAPICGTRRMDVGGIEALGSAEYIPVGGTLDVVDRETATIVQRQPAA